MSSQREEGKGESGEENSGSFGWLALGVATVVGGIIGAVLAVLSIRPGSTQSPQCNAAGPSTSSSNETFRNRPLKCEPCGICLDDIQIVVILPCGHRFHANCVERWLQENGTCPSCRQQINMDQLKYSV